ncbi:MAG: amidohydrolase family protein [Desulfobacter sp.]|nr:MAG: amidohydrolase family protein [Desulfobacter sp.]
MLSDQLPYFDDPHGDKLPSGISRVIDAHVHVFPDKIFSAVQDWFDAFAWKIRYRMKSRELIAFLLDRGVGRVVALQYAHKPGMADYLNHYMADLCREFGDRVIGLATLFPGEAEADGILNRAFDAGLSGVKLHAHVQCFDMNSPDMDVIYRVCRERNRPLLIHAGREPKSEHYLCDPYEICSAGRVDRVLGEWPGLKLCVPHLGFDETDAYLALVEKYDTLWLDTAMVLADYFPQGNPENFKEFPLHRILYGSDYPNIPYNWDRELKWLASAGLAREDLDRVLYRNAAEFYDLSF